VLGNDDAGTSALEVGKLQWLEADKTLPDTASARTAIKVIRLMEAGHGNSDLRMLGSG